MVPNSNKIFFITYVTNSHSCFACGVATNIFLYEKNKDNMKLISKDLKSDVSSTFGEAPDFKLRLPLTASLYLISILQRRTLK